MAAHNSTQPNWTPWFWLVLLTALAQRAALWFSYPPAGYNDTAGYRRLALTALKDWRGFDGTRVPGYPLWMALVGSDSQVYLSQLLLGLLITLLFFYLGWQAAHSPAFGALVAIAHTLNLNQALFEANLLSETLASFWLLLALACVWQALRPQPRGRWLAWLGVGLFGALAGLTRSLYLFIPFWAGLYLALLPTAPHRPTISFNWRPLVLICLPALLLIGWWVNYIYGRFGVFSVTTMGGFHLVQHTGQWFELLPDEEAVLRDVFLQYRAEQIAQTGSPGNTIWDALPALEKASGLGFRELSSAMMRLSIQLILQHPDRYLWSVLDGWQLYWRAPVYWKPDAFSPALRTGLSLLIVGQRGLLMLANLFFLVSTALALFWRGWRQRLGLTPAWVFLVLTLWLTSVLQSLPDHGDNPRFLVPQQSWVVFWGLWVFWRILQTTAWRSRLPFFRSSPTQF